MLRIPLNAIAQRLRQKRRAGPLQSGFDEDIVFDVDHINEVCHIW